MRSDISYYSQLTLFLKEAKTDNLKTRHYDSDYLGTEVKVSFGQGNTARVPWISFLKEPNKTSKGIYPVYLYYKEKDILILAYGVSETSDPPFKWKDGDSQTIREYFEKRYDEKPSRYGTSHIFEVYDVDRLPSKEKIDQDLNEIIDE